MKLNQVITLPKHDISSVYNNREKLESHVNKMIEQYHDTTIDTLKLLAVENIWTNICGIANYKKLVAHDEDRKIRTWIYSFKDDNILTIHEQY